MKYKGIQVITKTKAFNIIPSLNINTSQAIYPFIVVSPTTRKFLSSINKEKYYGIATLEHEYIHIQRMRQLGVVKWYFLYLANAKFRLEEELMAIKAQMKILKENKLSYNTEAKAEALSSWMYFKCIDYNKAKSKLNNLWKQ